MDGSTTAFSQPSSGNSSAQKQSDVTLVLNDPSSDQLKLKILQADNLFKSGKKQEALALVNQLLVEGEISFSVPSHYLDKMAPAKVGGNANGHSQT